MLIIVFITCMLSFKISLEKVETLLQNIGPGTPVISPVVSEEKFPES